MMAQKRPRGNAVELTTSRDFHCGIQFANRETSRFQSFTVQKSFEGKPVMSMQTRRLGLILFLAMMVALPLYGDPSPATSVKTEQTDLNKTEANKWMQLKLHSSQEILAGLTHGDFKKIEEQGRRLLVFNILENWRLENSLVKDSEYRGQLNSFEFATKELVRNADSKNIDGALNSYLLLTRSCVECHKLIRDVPKTPYQE